MTLVHIPTQRAVPSRIKRRGPLSSRELQVLCGMSHGKTNAHIGHKLDLAENTVKAHARTLFRKLGARDRAHAVAIALRLGLID